MHAYLIIGTNTINCESEVIKKLESKPLEFPIQKIEDVRQLSQYLKFVTTEKTTVVCRNIDNATTESLNAFLKNLEEPHTNISFILTATNEYNVIPTIVSRCQLIRVITSNNSSANPVANEDSIVKTYDFLESSLSNQLEIIDKIKTRQEATDFLKDVIKDAHHDLNKYPENIEKTSDNLEKLQATLTAINRNGNVSLQLTNLIVNLRNYGSAGLFKPANPNNL